MAKECEGLPRNSAEGKSTSRIAKSAVEQTAWRPVWLRGELAKVGRSSELGGVLSLPVGKPSIKMLPPRFSLHSVVNMSSLFCCLSLVLSDNDSEKSGGPDFTRRKAGRLEKTESMPAIKCNLQKKKKIRCLILAY